MLAFKNLINNSRNDKQDPQIRAATLSEAYVNARIQAYQMSLYGAHIQDVIAQILQQYAWSAKKNISKGTVNEAWTKAKIGHLTELLRIVEASTHQAISGDEIKNNLLVDIETQFLTEFLPTKRKEFSTFNSWMPDEGTLEKNYIPAIMKSIVIIHQVFSLFQIENRTRIDFRCPGEGSDEAVAFLHLAHDMTKEMSAKLLNDYSRTSLNSADDLLKEIKSECDQIMEDTYAARNQHSVASHGIDPNRLYRVYKVFVKKMEDVQALSLESASRNPVTLTKKAVNGTIGAAYSAASAFSSTSNYLTNKMVDLYIGKTQGPSSSICDDSDDDDDDPNCYVPTTLNNATHTSNMVRHSPVVQAKTIEPPIEEVSSNTRAKSNNNNNFQ